METHPTLRGELRVRAALEPHLHIVMFAQRVVCWDVPYVSIPYALALHVAWYFLAFSQSSFLSLVCQVLCVLVAIDLITTTFSSSIYNLIVDTESALEAQGRAHAQANILPFQKYIELRSFDDLCAALGSVSSTWRNVYHAWLNTHNQRPGKISFVSGVTFILLAYILSYISGVFMSYLFVLALIVAPPLERCAEVRRQTGILVEKCMLVVRPASVLLNKIFRTLPDRMIVVDTNANVSTTEEEERELQALKNSSMMQDDDEPVQRRRNPKGKENVGSKPKASGGKVAEEEVKSSASGRRERGWSLLYDSTMSAPGADEGEKNERDEFSELESSTLEDSTFGSGRDRGWSLLQDDKDAVSSSAAPRHSREGLRLRNAPTESSATASTPVIKFDSVTQRFGDSEAFSPIRSRDGDEEEEEGFTFVERHS